MTEQFLHFAGITRERLPSFGDEILTLLFNSAFNFLNDVLFVACLLRLCLCRLSLSIFVVTYSVVSRAENYPLDGLNHVLIYRVHTTGFSFPVHKWHDAPKPVTQCLDNPRMKLQLEFVRVLRLLLARRF